jgi:hypothetical protein
VPHGLHLVEWLWDVGPTVAGGMGGAPVESRHLLDWQAETGVTLQPWEAKLLRRLSRAYLAESMDADKQACPAPWSTAPTPDKRKRIAEYRREQLRLLRDTSPNRKKK